MAAVKEGNERLERKGEGRSEGEEAVSWVDGYYTYMKNSHVCVCVVRGSGSGSERK